LFSARLCISSTTTYSTVRKLLAELRAVEQDGQRLRGRVEDVGRRLQHLGPLGIAGVAVTDGVANLDVLAPVV